MSETWKTINDAEKKPFETMALKDAKRFAKEKKEFNETGFFTNTEGVHSSKLQAKPKSLKKLEKIYNQT